MADRLLNKVINDEISSVAFMKWLQNILFEEDEDYKKISRDSISRIDFVTHFINFIHEIRSDKSNDFSQTINISNQKDRTYEKEGIQEDSTKFSETSLLASEGSKLHSETMKNSTPKSNHDSSIIKVNDCFSPISPLYQQQNNCSYNNKSLNGTRPSDKYSLCLGDFLVNNSRHSKKKDYKKEVSRRIKPTSVCVKELNKGFQSAENSFNFQNSFSEVAVNTSAEQRNLLIKEKDKILSKCDVEKNFPSVFKRQNSNKEEIIPALINVSYKKQIEYVVEIYKLIINSQFILNVTSEIYFLISLLVTQDNGKKSITWTSEDQNLGIDFLENSENKYITQTKVCYLQLFESVHNIVYFAIKCLESQTQIIKFYDKTTLQLLGNNKRLQQFLPVFSRKLLLLADKKSEKAYNEIITPIEQNNVCFNIDTDNKDNFSDEHTFHAFRKQRDLFYDILRIWENNHLLAGWTYIGGLGGKIRTLFSLSSEPISYVHFARLFKNQLLTNCSKGPKEKGLSENNFIFLPSLSIDADKLNQLTNRLVTKQSLNGINSLPVFVGYQEFYRDFIVVASNYLFNKHLCDSLASEITELNETSFWETDLEKGKDVDANTRKQYISCIKNLRILAKFLGYIESIPYKSLCTTISENAMETQIKVRTQCVPLLDVKILLETSISRRTLILIIPWLTKYLSMLDQTTIRLPYYTSLNQMLFEIYFSLSFTEGTNYNVAVIKFCLGWLFELPHFPESKYFNFCTKISANNVTESKKPKVSKETKQKSIVTNLDDLNIVSQSVLYVCCPYLEEIKKTLTTSASGDKVPVKYITPITAVDSKMEASRKKLQNQLEEAFFNGHPTSVRKTVEFVSERVASTLLKHICHDMIAKAKLNALHEFRESMLKDDFNDKKYTDSTVRQAVLKKKAMVLAHNHLKQFTALCEQEVIKIAKMKIAGSIENLLPLDALAEMKEVCVGFSIKMCMERVRQWLTTHLTVTVFLKDLEKDIQKDNHGRKTEKISVILPSSGRKCNHTEDELSAVNILDKITAKCCDLIENKDILTEDVLTLLQQSYKSLTGRNDINDQINVVIHGTLFDFCLLLVSKQPSVFNNIDLLHNFAMIWKLQQQRKNSIFNYLFCPRNVRMLQYSIAQDEAWNCYAKIISYLVEQKLIEENDLEFQCTSFYNRDWEEATLAYFSNFLKLLLNYCKCDTTNSKFVMLLEFLSDFCLDL